MIDVKAYNIRWHNPKSKKHRNYTISSKYPTQSTLGGLRPNPKPGENPTRPTSGQDAEAYLRVDDLILNLSEEKRRQVIFDEIREHFNVKISGIPYSFDYEILDDEPPQPVMDDPRWKRTLQRGEEE